MTDVAAARLTPSKGEFPSNGTFGMAANTLLYYGQIVCLDSAGRACVPGAGCDAAGVAKQTFDNRTGSQAGGAADAFDAEVAYGVRGFLISGTAPKPKQVVYVVDNQTVSLDPTGNRGIAGIVSEVRTENGVAQAYVVMGPHIVAAIRGPLDVDVPLGGFRLATGAAIPAFAGGSADGYTLADSKALCLRINDDSTTVFWNSIKLPETVPAGAVVTLHVLASRIGATNTAVALLTPTVFANREGVAYDAGASLVSGSFDVMPGATKVVQELTKAITGALGGDVLSISLVAAAGLADNDLAIHSVWVSVR